MSKIDLRRTELESKRNRVREIMHRNRDQMRSVLEQGANLLLFKSSSLLDVEAHDLKTVHGQKATEVEKKMQFSESQLRAATISHSTVIVRDGILPLQNSFFSE